MRVLFISRELIAADLAYQLKKEGCKVRLFIENKDDKDCFDGMLKKTNDWKNELGWVGKNGLIVFDDVGYGKIQDDLRAKGYLVVGGSYGGDKLELNRDYCQQILKNFGVKISNSFQTRDFTINSAIKFVKKNKGRWVLKQNNHDEAFTYISRRKDGLDLISVLENYKDRFGGSWSCNLQKRVEGIEIAIGRFFNGKNWTGPLVINFEHKHLNNDDIGPMGGETGTLMWFEENEKNKLFQRTLAKIKPHLQEIKHKGYIDINCIVNKNTAYPLEITSRFGSSTNETQSEIQESSWKEILFSIAKGKNYQIKYKKEYGITVALTVSPFPCQTSDKKLIQKGVSIFFDSKLLKDNLNHIHFEEVSTKKIGKKNNYYISGNTGYILYVTGSGKTIQEAREKVYGTINKIIIPKMFYRTDIGLRFINKDQKLLKDWGWIN